MINFRSSDRLLYPLRLNIYCYIDNIFMIFDTPGIVKHVFPQLSHTWNTIQNPRYCSNRQLPAKIKIQITSKLLILSWYSCSSITDLQPNFITMSSWVVQDIIFQWSSSINIVHTYVSRVSLIPTIPLVLPYSMSSWSRRNSHCPYFAQS